MERLKDKVAIITGGATGIGEAISKKFALEGAKVIVNGLPEDPVNEVVSEITQKGGQAMAYIGNISEPQNAEECVNLAITKFGKLDILINNAGVFPEINELQDFSIETFDVLVKNNIKSAFLMTKYALPALQKTKGCIVSAGSEAGLQGIADNTPYGGTKGFIHAFTMGVAAEQARYGIRANCVCPGPIDTAWTHRETSDMDFELEKMMIYSTAMGRRGTPEEVANVYLFLASDEASYVTGALYPVDGGILIAKGPMGLKADNEKQKKPEGQLDTRHSKEGATSIK
ncbi:MAG: SDR family oxidoreductase [Bacteroidota bacterium]|nr:SDR family oxidoreductase [Bacteroidota bacterium]